MQFDLAIKSENIITPKGLRNGIILIRNGKIADIVEKHDFTSERNIHDVGKSVVMPGIIDSHVHINEPGRTEWEGFDTATKAAAAGGITTMIEMPLNSTPVTTSAKNFLVKIDAAKNKLHVNCGFWGGVVPGNFNELESLLDSGVFGLKAFLTHSGIDDFPNATAEHLRKALKILKKYNKPLLVHCELNAPNSDAKLLNENPRSYDGYLKSRPKSWENNAVKLMIDLCRETDAGVHIVHLSSAESLHQIKRAKAEGLKLSVETCPHYLFFNAEEIPDGATQYKCAPPIREEENNAQLWDAVHDGTIDFIVTDHSPAPPALKEIESGNFKKAWGGIAGLQYSLAAFWTKARTRGFTVENISKLMSGNVADFIKPGLNIGKIEKGFDADIVVWNPENKFIVEENLIQHRHKITPYLNKELYGVVEQTFTGGIKVYDNGNFVNLNKGKLLLKK